MTDKTTAKPTPAVKALLREFAKVNREKYGPDWKAKVAEELAAETTPFLRALLSRRKRLEPPK